MVDRAEAYLPAFAHAIQAGANERPKAARGLDVKEERDVIVSFHPETTWHPARTIEHIRELGMRPAIALSPAIPVERFAMLLHDVEAVVVMTVNPGYSGQKLIPWTLDKVRELVRLRREKGYRYEIEIDGNVSWDNIPGMIEAGGDVLVAGTSSMFGQRNQRRWDIRRLKSLVAAS
jgi:ribulose-phosphate 3-epimerase